MYLHPLPVVSHVALADVSDFEVLLVTANGPHPTEALAVVVDVSNCSWIADVSPAISKTTLQATKNAI